MNNAAYKNFIRSKFAKKEIFIIKWQCSCIISGIRERIDTKVMGWFCRFCGTVKNFEKSDHFKANHKCSANYEGSPSNLEVTGAKVLISWSIGHRKLRHDEM